MLARSSFQRKLESMRAHPRHSTCQAGSGSRKHGRVVGRGSWVTGRGSRVTGRGSRVEQRACGGAVIASAEGAVQGWPAAALTLQPDRDLLADPTLFQREDAENAEVRGGMGTLAGLPSASQTSTACWWACRRDRSMKRAGGALRVLRGPRASALKERRLAPRSCLLDR